MPDISRRRMRESLRWLSDMCSRSLAAWHDRGGLLLLGIVAGERYAVLDYVFDRANANCSNDVLRPLAKAPPSARCIGTEDLLKGSGRGKEPRAIALDIQAKRSVGFDGPQSDLDSEASVADSPPLLRAP